MTAATVTTDSVETRSAALRYRPYLDGMRAVAVYVVVAFHAGLGLVNGGFIGVDIFFVLSGFLVTRILMRDLAATGHVRWRSFYSRRVRRILPAALITLLVTAVVYAVIASPLEIFDALGGFRAAFFYVANWFFIHQATDYFAANVNSNPVLHFWSLAVEEQFYFVWPLLLGGVYLVARRARRHTWWIVRVVVVAAGIASAVEALHIGSTNLQRAYYGTDTRAYQLLAGAALALTPQLLHLGARFRAAARLVGASALAALVVLATSAFSMSAITRGVLVAAIVAVLIAALENARGGLAQRVLSLPPFTYLGRISYGIYLWHWPVIVIAGHDRHLSPLQLFAIAVPFATALAALSFHLLEHPIRASQVLDRFRTPVVAIGFTTSILIGVLVAPAILSTDNGSVGAAERAALPLPGPKLLNWHDALADFVPHGFHDCLNKPVDTCTIVKGTGLKIVLVGDSVARMWIPAFTELAKKDSLTFSTASFQGCPWQRGLQYYGAVDGARQCAAHQDDWYNRVIPQLHPDIVFVAQRGYDDPNGPNRFYSKGTAPLTYGDANFEPALARYSRDTIHALQAPGRRIVILEPVPVAPVSPVRCLSRGGDIRRCGFLAARGLTPLERFFRHLAATEPDVTSIDLDKLVCPHMPGCAAVVGNIIVWRDVGHITVTYSDSLGPQLDAVLRRKRVLGAR